MDDYEFNERIENLEGQVDRLTVIVDKFIKGFDGKIQNQLASFIELIADKPKNKIENYDDYLTKLICNIGIGQACILKNQERILELLGEKNISIKGISVENKRRAVEKILSEMENPYKSIK